MSDAGTRIACLIAGRGQAGPGGAKHAPELLPGSTVPPVYGVANAAPLFPEDTMIAFSINGKDVTVEVDADTPLLWVLRDELKLMGTKYGCGIAMCGACTVYLDGNPRRSCATPVSAVEGAKVTTIEGLSGQEAAAVYDAWVALDVPQCGYCQSGQIMAAVALLREIPKPSDADIDGAMAGNVCRCATYVRIRAAIHQAAKALGA
jgi:isoquinoline 1-oxidoreductase alpha subunit